MNKLVYLFELDSVNKFNQPPTSGVSFSPAIKALFNEIIKNGNSVAISMNQLTDSQFIKEILEDDFAYNCLLKLFENAAIRISLYDNIQSASQYVQKSIEKCLSASKETFIFSNLPVLDSEKELLAEIHDALEFSNLSKIQTMIDNSTEKEKYRLELIYRFIYVVLQISICEKSYILPKQTKKRSFEEFMTVIINSLKKNDFTGINNIDAIISYLDSLNDSITVGRNNRSNWLNYSLSDAHILTSNKIINLCYNYTVEDSINGVAKHYTQICFPRGFGENGIPPMENAKKELFEEVGLIANECIFLGKIIPDSGISSSECDVFLCKIFDESQLSAFSEGIKSVYHVSFEEFEDMIKINQINDSFTLSAFTLLKTKNLLH